VRFLSVTKKIPMRKCVGCQEMKNKREMLRVLKTSENEFLLDAFFKRKTGNTNHLSLPPDETEELIALCHKMVENEPLQSRKYYNFFRLISILQNADIVNNININYPEDTGYAINYINRHFKDTISVREIAKCANVSINTLERHFMQTLNVSPSAYIRKKRLTNAARLLSEGYSVTEAACQSGFPDYSNFISLFRKTYGITPLKYMKKKHNHTKK